jgi:DNA-directed RNA polymerase subunit beta'
MRPSYNVLSPSNGEVILKPTQDMVIGCYYLTLNNIKNSRGSYHYFSDFNDALLAYANSKIDLHSTIWVRNNQLNNEDLNPTPNLVNKYQTVQCKTNNKNEITVKYLKTTVGRILFNDVVTNANFF